MNDDWYIYLIHTQDHPSYRSVVIRFPIIKYSTITTHVHTYISEPNESTWISINTIQNSQIGWNWNPTRLNSCGLDPDNSWQRSTQRPWQSVSSEHRIESSTSTKNLGVTFDSELGMDLHVNNITWSCFYHLRQLRSIRRSLSTDATKTLVHSLISSRVDYCNSIFYGATNIVVRRLQSFLNAAARLISNKRKFDHITPVLRDQLHWLPIHQRIEFKIAVFVRNAVHGRGPTYLECPCNPVREVDARSHLRSAARGDLTVLLSWHFWLTQLSYWSKFFQPIIGRHIVTSRLTRPILRWQLASMHARDRTALCRITGTMNVT